jgi:hypothetical protein
MESDSSNLDIESMTMKIQNNSEVIKNDKNLFVLHNIMLSLVLQCMTFKFKWKFLKHCSLVALFLVL